MNSKTVRLEDIAQRAGVSITTVSHVINKTRYVKKETRDLILHILEELNYDIKRPKAKTAIPRIIGVIVADITEDYYIEVVKAIETYATQLGISLLLCDSENDVDKEKLNIKNILEKDVGGLIISPVNSEVYPREIKDAEIPVVLVDRKFDRHDKIFVGINNFESGYQAAAYLAAKGCASIGFIGYHETVYTVNQRAKGYRDFMQERLPDRPAKVLKLSYRQEDSYQLIKDFLAEGGLDGLICATSDVCHQLVSSLEEMGVGIPGQVKIVTYDDNKWLDFLKYPVSVITQPTSEIGFTAIDSLVRLLKNPEEKRRIGTDIYLETGFIDRL